MNGTRGACTLSPYPDSQMTIGNINTMYNSSNKEYDYKIATNKGCPSGSSNYVYGCYCMKNNIFFDRNKWICSYVCSGNTIKDSGICINCPENCVTCEKSQKGIKYLDCNTCQ